MAKFQVSIVCAHGREFWFGEFCVNGLQAVLFLSQQDRKCKLTHVVAYVPRFDVYLRCNVESGRLFRDGVGYFYVAI